MVVRERFVCGVAALLVALLVALMAGCHSGSGEERVGLFDNGSASGVGTEQSQLRGDMDGDGNPSVSDAIAILRIVVGFDTDAAAADADGDGSITVADAILILRCVVGLSEWPLGNLCGTNVIDLTAALAAPMATNPHAASTDMQNALNAYLASDDNIPDTTAELTADLAGWVANVTNDPDDVGAQLGLTLAIVAAAGHNAADSMCMNIFEEVGLIEVASVVVREDTAPASVMTQTLQTMLAQNMPTVPVLGGDGIGTAAAPVSDLEGYRAAINDYLLGPLENAVERTAACTVGAAGQLLVELTDEAETVTLYPADVLMVTAGLRTVRALLLMASAFDPDYGSWDWDLDLDERDANGDGILTVAEYAPPAPFATVDATNWTAAGAWLRDAVADIRAGLAIRSGDVNSLIGRYIEDPVEFAAYADDAADIFGGQVNMTFNYTETASAGVRTEAIETISVNLREIFDTPPASIQSMLPPLYLMLSEGSWTFPGVGEFLLWWEERVDDDTINYWWWFEPAAGTGLGDYVDIAIGAAPHVVGVPAAGEFPGAQLSFPSSWASVTGTIGPVNVSGTTTEGRDLLLAATPKWGDVPDNTFSGVFPDPDKVGEAILRNYDDWTLTYGSIQLGPGAAQ